MKRNLPIDIDQTSFVDQVPISAAPRDDFDLKHNLKQNRNLRPFYIILGLMIFIILIYLLVLIFARPPQEEEILTRAVDTSMQLDPLSLEVEKLRTELRQADPTRQSLPFPSVDLEFSLE